MEKEHFHDHSLSSTRIEAFSDAVFAIICTLLVLDLKVPEVIYGASPQLTLHALMQLLPQFLSFALSFLIICIFWVNHHQFFSVIKKADRKVLWLNNFLLFWLSFIPFPTAFLGHNPTNMGAIMLFGAVLCCSSTVFYTMTYYVFIRTKLFDHHVGINERRAIIFRSSFGPVLYGLSVVLAPVSIYLSILIFIIVPMYYFVPRRFKFTY